MQCSAKMHVTGHAKWLGLPCCRMNSNRLDQHGADYAVMSGPRLSAFHKLGSSCLAFECLNPLGRPNCRAYHVLLSDEALDVAVGEGLLEGLGES